MAQIALPRQQGAQAPQSAGIGSPLYQRRQNSNVGSVELLPNPDFTFPMRAVDSQPSETSYSSSTTRPMSLQVYPAGRRGSSHAPRQKSVSALPDFSFNPAGVTKPTTTPPQSPLVSPSTPSRPVGHRRGGSEFIGGDVKAGVVPTLLSSSPPKSDGMMSVPSANLRPGPPAGRRGHAHRRSGAISSHDLSTIMRPAEPSVNSRAGSAPVTPLEGDQFIFRHCVNKSISQPSLRDAGFFPDDPNSSPRRPPSRARVGFSDKVEYIRPLSTISSETETSLSTIRCHSATGSLSSIVSAGTSSPASARTRPSLGATMEKEGRPSTAGAVLDMSKHASTSFKGDASDRKRPMSAISPISPDGMPAPPSPQVLAKRKGFFRFDSRRSVPFLPTSASDPALSASLDRPLSSPLIKDDNSLSSFEKSKSVSRKAQRKPRKVKSWANSIISRKGKNGTKPKNRAPTPTEEKMDTEDSSESEDLDFEANFDVDNTVTIVTPREDEATIPKLDTCIASWKPRELKRVDSDVMNPVIDLDAALGPFNTPQGTNSRGQRGGFGAHRRAMHSAGGVVQSHRRTESAPELVPFELRTTAIGPTSGMADVFEEEEPEDDSVPNRDLKSPASSKQDLDEDVDEPKIQVVETVEAGAGPMINWNFNDGLGINRTEKEREEYYSEPLSPLQVPKPMSSGNDSKQPLHATPVEVVEDYEEPRTYSLTHSSDSTVTPQLSVDEAKESQPIMKLSLPLPEQSLRTPDTFASSFSSPDFRSSQASLDTPRLGTAASSMTDYRAMPSPQFGEPGPDVRISVDDVPSLTSSRSTMTNHFPLLSPRRPGERSSSLCSAPSETEQHRQKRSSIASLSRLINSSSFGEKSKLSIEQRPHSEYLQPAKDSKKKHKRLSKLMQFWKAKDTSRT